MRCLLCVSMVLAAACAAPEGDSYGAPPPLTPAQEERTAALDALDARLADRGPLGARGRVGPLERPGGRYGGSNGRFGGPGGRFGGPGGRFGGPGGRFGGSGSRFGGSGGRFGGPGGRFGGSGGRFGGSGGRFGGPGGRFGGPLAGRLPNQGNPPQLRPDGLLDGPGVPYSFNWAVDEPDYGNQYGHQEESDGVVTQGEYRVLLPDGRTQIVTYSVEGDSGFQATVTYEGEAQFPPPGAPGGPGGPAPFGSALGGGPLSRVPLAGRPLGRGPLGRGPLGRGPLAGGPLGRGPLGRGPLGRGPLGLNPFGPLAAAGRSIPDVDDVLYDDVNDAPVEKPSTSYGY